MKTTVTSQTTPTPSTVTRDPAGFEHIKDIPKSPNSIELGGGYDPQPELGEKGSGRRRFWSWLKGWV